MRKEIIALTSVLLMLIVGVTFADVSNYSDAADQSGSTYYVAFTTDSGSTGGNGSGSDPFMIKYVRAYGTDDTFPNEIENGDTLIVTAVSDTCNIERKETDNAKYGHYNIHENVNLKASESIKDERWNVSIYVHGAIKVNISGFLFGELFIDSQNGAGAEITLDDCRFILDDDSVNYTDNGDTTNRFNIKTSPGTDLTIHNCEFISNIDNGTNRSCAIYPYSGADRIDLSDSTFNGYNQIMNAVKVTDLNVNNNQFLNLRQFDDEHEGCAISISEGMDNATISGNTATSTDGSSNVFLRISSDCVIKNWPLS